MADAVSGAVSAAPRRTGRLFYLAASAAIVATVFIGFAPTYYLKGYFGKPPLLPLLHVHGMVFTGWVLLFVTQVALIARRRVDLHRRLGVAGAWWAGVLVVIGLAAALDSLRRHYAAGEFGVLPFLIVPLGDMLTFAALAGAGLWLRHKPEAHKRLMFLATVTLLSAAVARWPLENMQAATNFYPVIDFFLIAGCLYDLVSRRRVHSVYLWAGPLIVAFQWLRLAAAGSGAWLAFARALAR